MVKYIFVTANLAIKVSSLAGSMPGLAISWGAMLKVVTVGMKRVYPSAGELATSLAPKRVLAPARLSITTDCFQVFCISSAIARPKISTKEPGMKGTTSLIGLLG